MNIGKLLKEAWHTVWKHKILMIFGLFLFISQVVLGFAITAVSSSPTLPFMPDLPEIRIILAVGAPVVTIIMVAVMLVTRIALVRGVWQVGAGAEPLGFGDLIRGVRPYLARTFGLLVFYWLLDLIIGRLNSWLTNLNPALAYLSILTIVLTIVMTVWSSTALAGVIGDDLSATNALATAFHMLRSHPGQYLVGIIVVFGLTYGSMFVFIIPVVIIAFLISGPETASRARDLVVIGTIGAGLGLFYLFFYTYITTFGETLWTLAYLRQRPAVQPAPAAPELPLEPPAAE
jgi:hypothetical protein